jgi:NADH-quinone oxidoreductase subunit H
MTFAQFFLGENINIIMMCALISIFFCGGGSLLFFNFNSSILFRLILIIKIILFLFSFVWVRVTFPRYRYDQLMRLGWKIFLPLTLALVLFISSIMLSFNLLV